MTERIDAARWHMATCLADRLKVIEGVSYLGPGEVLTLFEMYTEACHTVYPEKHCVEIGARFGCSTLTLALAARETGTAYPIYSIDPHGWVPASGTKAKSFETLRYNLQTAGLAARVIPIVGLSSDVAWAWEANLSLLWIDGDHSYNAVTKDLRNWAPFVIDGGIVCGHDYMEEPRGPDSVKKAVDVYAAEMGRSVEVYNSIWRIK
jgi:predicted O-methyltransferase YrrM